MDVEMCRCGCVDVEMWRCVDVEMCKCVGVEVWRCGCGDVEIWSYRRCKVMPLAS